MAFDYKEKFSVAGKKCIVTGAAQGLSRGMAEGLLENGAEVVLMDLQAEKLQAVADEYCKMGYKAHAVAGDLSKKPEIDRMFAEAMEILGNKLDVMIPAAGIQRRYEPWEFPEDAWRLVIDVDLNHVWFMCQKAVQVMKDKEGSTGKIINIASMNAFFGGTTVPAYTAAKGAVAMLTKSLASDCADHNICCNAIAPGYMASNCAPVTQISIMYHEDGSFCDIPRLKEVPVHCFINPKLVLAAPVKYLWAGIGDAMAKHVESSWSAKAGEKLSFGSEFGITAGQMCFYPMVKDAKKAMDDAKAGRNSEELENTILNIVVSPGVVSVSVHPNYNGGIAHALFYGLTKREHIEKKHLHGEVVSYGTLVNLMVDKDWDKLKLAYGVNKSIDLPVCLADLELEKDDKLEDVLEATMANQEMTHTPYPVTKEMIYQAIQDLEDYKG